MSGNSMEAFAEACGASGSLYFNLSSAEDSCVELEITQPFALIGRRADADLKLDHSEVSRRHAYVQLVEGRLFCVDLGSRRGIRVQGNGPNGWLDPFSTLGIGPYDLQLVRRDVKFDATSAYSGDEPTPLSSRHRTQSPLSEVTLEMHFPGLRPVSCSMNLTMALVGRSEFCKIKPPIRDASRFYCSLLRTPTGVWLVDLLAPERVTVNGETHRFALLSDGDEVRFGGCTLVIRHGPAAGPPSVFALNGHTSHIAAEVPTLRQPASWMDLNSAPTVTARPDPLHSPDALAVLQQMGQMQQQMSEQFHETMGMLAQLFGTIHRDHVSSIRDELQQIRALADEIRKLQSPPSPLPSPAPTLPASTDPPTNPSQSLPPVAPSPPDDIPKGDPHHLLAVATARLEAYQREQQSRWRKILRMLTP